MNTFGKRLKAARNVIGINQEELGNRTGIYASSISHLEADHRKPSIVNLLRLCDALGVSSDYLLGRTLNRPKSKSGKATNKPTDSKTSSMIQQYNKLSKEHQDVVDILLKVLVRSQDRIRHAESQLKGTSDSKTEKSQVLFITDVQD